MRDDELRKLIAEEWDRYMRLIYAPVDKERLYREMIANQPSMINTFMRTEMAREKKEKRLDELETEIAELLLDGGISFSDMAKKLRAAQMIQIELARMAISRERSK